MIIASILKLNEFNPYSLFKQHSDFSALTKKVRDELYRLLVEKGRYFG